MHMPRGPKALKIFVPFVLLSLVLGCELLTATDRVKPSAFLETGRASAPLPPPLPHSKKRIIAIGDLHGDLAVTRKALRLGGAIDEAGRWIGGDLVVIQTGDEIDRGDDDRLIIDLFEKLRVEAKAAGGAVYPLTGNHETMNVAGDFRYVTEGAFKDFTLNEGFDGQAIPDLPEERQARAQAFAPGGKYAKILATRPIMLVVGNTAFAHGGIRSEHAQLGLDRMNQDVAAWMLGKIERPAFVKDAKGPLWMRDYSESVPSSAACAMLKDALASLGIRRMVVGHTIQDQGINAACNQGVWRIDIGMSAHYGKNRVQVLQIIGDEVKVLAIP